MLAALACATCGAPEPPREPEDPPEAAPEREPEPDAVPEEPARDETRLATCDAPVPIYQDGAEAGTVCPDAAAAQGLTLLALADGWTPRIFSEDPSLGDVGLQPYRPVYLALADERWDDLPEEVEAERHLELFGISPTFRVLRERVADRERHTCHANVASAPIEAYTVALRAWSLSAQEQRGELAHLRFLDAMLENAREREGLPTIEALIASGWRPGSVREWQRLHQRVDAVRAVQAHLVCDGLLPRYEDGIYDGRVSAALAEYQRMHLIVAAGTLDAATRAHLVEPSQGSDFEAVLRALRERVVDATGLIEDGSARHAWGTVLGRTLDPPEMRFEGGREALENGAPDLVSPATEAAARALGWTDADGFLAFFDREDVPRLVAVRLPPVPDYHAEHMDLRAEIDRGDVWFEYPYTNEGRRRSLPVEQRAVLTLYARTEAGEVALMRWATTIGGWKPERAPGGGTGLRYKESPAGPRIWRDVIAAPAWLPPNSTPDDELVRRGPGGRWLPHTTLFGPSHRSAYGLAMVMHHRPIERDGVTTFYDEGVRSHGSVSYRSILTGTSHGCHRLYNHLAVRLMDFLVAHRHHVRRGSIPTLYGRHITIGGQEVNIRIRSRGYLFELTPPVEVNVLPGRILGSVTEAPRGFRPLPEALAAAAAEAAAADEGM